MAAEEEGARAHACLLQRMPINALSPPQVMTTWAIKDKRVCNTPTSPHHTPSSPCFSLNPHTHTHDKQKCLMLWPEYLRWAEYLRCSVISYQGHARCRLGVRTWVCVCVMVGVCGRPCAQMTPWWRRGCFHSRCAQCGWGPKSRNRVFTGRCWWNKLWGRII